MIAGVVLCYHFGCPCYCPSVCLSSIILFVPGVNVNGFSPNFLCALILWRSGLGMLMGKFSLFDEVICPRHPYFRFIGFSPNLVNTLILWRSGLG